MGHWIQFAPVPDRHPLFASALESQPASSSPIVPLQPLSSERNALLRQRRHAFDTIGRDIVVVKARYAERRKEMVALENAVEEIRQSLTEGDASPRAFVRLHEHLCEKLARVRAIVATLKSQLTHLECRLRSEIAVTYKRLEALEERLRDTKSAPLPVRSVA